MGARDDDDFYKANFTKLIIFDAPNVSQEILLLLLELTSRYIVYVSQIEKEDVMKNVASLSAPMQERIRTTWDNLFEDDLNRALDKALNEAKPKFIAEGMEKGIQKGIQKGMEKGQAEAMQKMLFQYLSKFPHFTDQEVAETFDVPLALVRKVRKSITSAKNGSPKKG